MARQEPVDRLSWTVHISLLGGLLISAALLVLGATLVLMAHQSRSETRPLQVAVLFSRAVSGDGVAILDVGILILMLTPVLRVIVLAVGWLIDRQWRFAIVALIVFALLTTSLLLGTG
jgi:uncharacterized membrane protein